METVDDAFTAAHKVVDKIASAANHTAEALDEKGEQLKNAEHCMVDHCNGYIRSNPIASIGIAVAAGFMLSRLLGSR